MIEDKYTYKLNKINDNLNEIKVLLNKILECLVTQEENNKKIANMIHEFSLGSDSK